MAKIKYRWIARMGYQVWGGSVRFRGREPFTPPNEVCKNSLLKLGVFEALRDGTMRYSAPLKLRCQCQPEGKPCTWVDPDGIAEVDTDHLQKDLIDAGIEYELADPSSPIPQPYYTVGVDHPDGDPAKIAKQEK